MHFIGLGTKSDIYFLIASFAGFSSAISNSFLKSKYYADILKSRNSVTSFSTDGLLCLAISIIGVYIGDILGLFETEFPVYLYLFFFMISGYFLTLYLATSQVEKYELRDLVGQSISIITLTVSSTTEIFSIFLVLTLRYIPNVIIGAWDYKSVLNKKYTYRPTEWLSVRAAVGSTFHKGNGLFDRLILMQFGEGFISIYSLWEVASNLYIRVLNRTVYLKLINQSVSQLYVKSRELVAYSSLAICVWVFGCLLVYSIPWRLTSELPMIELAIFSVISVGFMLSQISCPPYLQVLYANDIDGNAGLYFSGFYILFWAIKFMLGIDSFYLVGVLNSMLGIILTVFIFKLYLRKTSE